MTNYSRSVLKSNGLHRSKNLPVKFGFSSKTVPANIVQKLSAHSLLKSVFFRISTSRTNGPRLLSRAKASTHSAFGERLHTTAHTPKQGAFPSAITVRLCAASEIPFSPPRFYIHTFPGSLWTLTIGRGKNSGKAAVSNSISNRFSSHLSTPRTNGPRSLSRAKVRTHSALLKGSHTRAHTAKQGYFGWGWYYYPRTVSHVSKTLCSRISERQTLPLWGLGQGCSRSTQRAFGTAMRLCASLFRGIAAPLGCVIFLQFGDVAVFSLCAQYFLNVRGRGGITTPGVLRMLLKLPAPACQSD